MTNRKQSRSARPCPQCHLLLTVIKWTRLDISSHRASRLRYLSHLADPTRRYPEFTSPSTYRIQDRASLQSERIYNSSTAHLTDHQRVTQDYLPITPSQRQSQFPGLTDCQQSRSARPGPQRHLILPVIKWTRSGIMSQRPSRQLYNDPKADKIQRHKV